MPSTRNTAETGRITQYHGVNEFPSQVGKKPVPLSDIQGRVTVFLHAASALEARNSLYALAYTQGHGLKGEYGLAMLCSSRKLSELLLRV